MIVFEYAMLPVRVVMLKCAMKPVVTFTVRGHRENKYSSLCLNASVRTDGHPYVTGRSCGRRYSSKQFLTKMQCDYDQSSFVKYFLACVRQKSAALESHKSSQYEFCTQIVIVPLPVAERE